MNEDRLGMLLREVPIPPSAHALEVTIARARELAPDKAARPTPAARRRGWGRRRMVLAFVLLVLALLTPPGRAAVERLGELTGLRDTGKEPTSGPLRGERDAVILHAGIGPDGKRYEWIVSRRRNPVADGPTPMWFCIGLDWPGVTSVERSGSCAPRGARVSHSPHGFEGYGLQRLAPDGGARRGIAFVANLIGDVRSVEVLVDSGSGPEPVRADFARVDQPELLARAGRDEPFGLLVATITAEQLPPPKDLYSLGPAYPQGARPQAPGCPAPTRRGPITFVFTRGEDRRQQVVETQLPRRGLPERCR